MLFASCRIGATQSSFPMPSPRRSRQCSAQGDQKSVGCLTSSNLLAATYVVALFVMTCTTLSIPTSMTTSSNNVHNFFAFFILLEASTNIKNSSPFEETKKLRMVWFFPSIHPLERMVQPCFFHCLFWSSTTCTTLLVAFVNNLQVQSKISTKF